MAIDLRQSREGYTDRCIWYKGVAAGNQFTKDPTACGVFYAKDASAEVRASIQVGAVMTNVVTTSIETPDLVDGLSSNDFISYDGETWLVVSVQRLDVDSKMRQYSGKSKFKTVIQLRR